MNRRLCVPVVHAVLLTAMSVCADDFPNAAQLRGESEVAAPQTVAPFEAAPVVDATPVRVSDQIPLGPRPDAAVDADGTGQQSRPGSGLSPGTLIGSLAFVIVLILGLAKLVMQKSPFAVGGVPEEAVNVLGRRTVDPRNAVYVVQVGSKILLLGTSANGLTPLSEITDPIEVATLANQCRAEKSASSSRPNWLPRLFGGKPNPPDRQSFTERFGGRLAQDNASANASRSEGHRVA